MAHQIIWSPEAVADLVELRDYIARDSESYAVAMVERLLLAVDQLGEFPKLGQRVPELDEDSIRQLVVAPFRVIYRCTENSADIAAVVHGARDLPHAIEGRRI